MSKSPAPVPDAGNLTTFSCPPKPNLQSHWRFHGHQLNHARYDELGRLKTAVTDGSAAYPQWGLEWSYDRYGNRLNQTKTHGTAFQSYLTLDASTNRISDRTYDASGNLWQDGYAYKYDAESRAVDYGAGGVTYAYDASGLRVKRTYGASTTVYIFSGSKVIAEYASGAAATSPTREYIYAGRLLASIESGTTKYYYSDHLSARMTMVGGTATQQGHFPFGENWYPTSTTEKWKFTSYERGDENGNDYAVFRSYISSYGRFQTPDPAGRAAVDATNPQSWNRYAYVANNAINAKNPSGLKIALVSMACTWDPVCSGGGGYVDGVLTNMGMVSALLNSGAGVQCPGNICEIADSNGGFAVEMQFRAFAGMGTGYYAASGPGSWYFSAEAAGKAAVNWINGESIKQDLEYSGNLYADANRVFSFTAPKPGFSTMSQFNPNDIPGGTVFAGDYHTHGDYNPAYDNERFSSLQFGLNGPGDIEMALTHPGNEPMFLGTPFGRIEVFYPATVQAFPLGCVLVGDAVPGVANVPGVPKCH